MKSMKMSVTAEHWIMVLENLKRENYHYHCGKKWCSIHDVCMAYDLKNLPTDDVKKALHNVIYGLEDTVFSDIILRNNDTSDH